MKSDSKKNESWHQKVTIYLRVNSNIFMISPCNRKLESPSMKWQKEYLTKMILQKQNYFMILSQTDFFQIISGQLGKFNGSGKS